MSIKKWLLLSFALIGIAAFGDRPEAQGPGAAFHAIGDLPGGSLTTLIKDATRGSDGALYAVGGAVAVNTCAVPCTGTDTAILWRLDGGNATLTPIPNFVTGGSQLLGPVAWAINRGASYIAAQLRAQPNPPTFALRAAQVTTSSLNVVDLAPTLNIFAGARALSESGSVFYGFTGSGASTTSARFELSGLTTPVPPLPSHATTAISPRATSADGQFAVGSSVLPGVLRRAIRYEHGVGVTEIPLLEGGNHSDGLAVSLNGDLVLATGNSDAYPRGEAYLYRFSTGDVQPLGSPNTVWSPGARVCAGDACSTSSPALFNGMWMGSQLVGGVTDDGSVVAMSFFGPDGQSAYIRNANGWFHLASVLGANGIDISADGWEMNTIQVQGISPDGTLVFGSGAHNGVTDGFVAEFAPGVLASFNPQPAPPASTALVGLWAFDDPGNLAAPDTVVVFTADGVYYHLEGEHGEPLAGFERGFYAFSGSQLLLTTLFDTNGSTGLAESSGSSLPVTVVGDTLLLDGEVQAHRITGGPNSIVGAWVGGEPTEPHNSLVVVAAGQGYFALFDFADGHSFEKGTYEWDPITHEFVATVGGVTDPGNFVTLTPDALGIHVEGDDGEVFDAVRVIDPSIVPAITNADLSADGTVGQAFSYDVTATNTVTYSATGLPNGLAIGPISGEISGTPTVGGQFAVSLKATSALGVSDIETLVLTVAIPTPVGQNVVVEPQVPEGQGPVTLSFSEVTVPGTTTVEIVELEDLGVPPPGSVQIAGVIYDVETTAEFEGLITLCFSYAGIDFGGATPRLFHFENNVWVDITTSVTPATQTICGATTSLSPFAVLASNVVRTGFYAPVNPIAGYLNTVTGGSTVPLKFNVQVNGVNQTSTSGIAVSVQTMTACDVNAPEDPVEAAETTGGTTLRYDSAAGYFVQNWRVPRTPGKCYMVRATTQADGLALTARFRVR